MTIVVFRSVNFDIGRPSDWFNAGIVHSSLRTDEKKKEDGAGWA